MPFSISDSINGAVDGVLGSPFLKKIASSPLYTALIITILVVFIAIICSKFINDTMAATIVRMGFWVYVAVVLVLLLHNRIMQGAVDDKLRAGSYQEFIGAGTHTLPPEYTVPINYTDTALEEL